MMKMCSDMMNNMNPGSMMEKGKGMMQECMAMMSDGKDEDMDKVKTTSDQAEETLPEDSGRES